MTWTFKDRYNPTRSITIHSETAELIKNLVKTLPDFRHYCGLNRVDQKKMISDHGIKLAKVIYIHTQINYCSGTHNLLDDLSYNEYCEFIKKNFANIHPLFAIKNYADCISSIRSDSESI